MSSISERAMLTSLRVSMWLGRAHDAEVTEEVSTDHKADPKDSGSWSKQLISKEFIKPVGGQANLARRTHRLMTLPWDDDGTRILSTRRHPAYTDAMRVQRHNFEAAVVQFVAGYPEMIKEAKVRLGTMFDPNDYPDTKEVKEKFGLEVEIKPVPMAGDFRAELSEASVKVIVKDIERRTKARLDLAMDDVFKRVAAATSRMVESLKAFDSKESKRFHDSTVYNILELADMIPDLNITNDERLTKLAEQLKSELVEHSPEVLKVDVNKRKATAIKAEKILKRVKQYLA